VPFGCGTAAIILLVVLVGVAAGISSGAFRGMFEMALASMEGEIEKMMAPDVKPNAKAAFEAEMKGIRESVRAGRLKIDRLQPLMRTMRETVIDERVTAAEVEELTRAAHAVNSTPPK